MNVRTFFRLLAVAVALLLLTGTSDRNSRVFASPGFDIPISDLKKVEKKKQRKPEGRRSRESKKSKKSDAEKTGSPATTTTAPTPTPAPAITTPQTSTTAPVTTEKTVGPAAVAPTAVETVAPAVPASPVTSPPRPSVAQPETKPAPAAPEPEKSASAPSVTIEPATAKPAVNPTDRPLPPEEEEYRISHEPFSYLVAGKMTKLMAVVISKNDVLTMRCRFRAGEKGQYGEIEMLLAPGSKFTYSAVIPALIPGATALYYEFVLTDNQGKKFRSQEYRIPLNATAVVPGWQYGLSRARINVVLENPAQPFEGFVGLTAGEN